jgi:hypothetical protein
MALLVKVSVTQDGQMVGRQAPFLLVFLAKSLSGMGAVPSFTSHVARLRSWAWLRLFILALLFALYRSGDTETLQHSAPSLWTVAKASQ